MKMCIDVAPDKALKIMRSYDLPFSDEGIMALLEFYEERNDTLEPETLPCLWTEYETLGDVNLAYDFLEEEAEGDSDEEFLDVLAEYACYYHLENGHYLVEDF